MNRSPRNEKLSVDIESAFPGSGSALSDQFIEMHPELASLQGASTPPLLVLVPAYMAWCVRNSHRPEELVHDYTLNALAEFGRSKNPAIEHLNFKHLCSVKQQDVVAKFLSWCLDPTLLLHTEQIERALKHWAPAPSQ